MGSERRMCFETQCATAIALQSHPRSLILAPIESAYATSYRSSIVTFVLYLATFQRYCSFSVEKSETTALLPEFWGDPLALHCRYRAPKSEDPKLITGVIIFELVQPLCLHMYNNVTDGRTDERTDDLR